MAIIGSTLARIKSDPVAYLGGAKYINDLFGKAGYRLRDCVWDPATTLGIFILQILHGNVSISALRHLTNLDIKPSTYCDARIKLPAKVLAQVVEWLCGDCCRCMEQTRLWLGRRVFLSDCTCVTTPDEPAMQKLWPQPKAQKPGCGFPNIKLLGLLDQVTGMIVHLTMMCLNVHEMSQLPGMHGMLQAGDVLLADRGFCSFMHVAMLLKSSVDAVFRMHQKQIVDFTPNRPHRLKGKKFKRGMPTSQFVRRLGHEDQVVKWARAVKPQWMSQADYANLPQWIEVRELRYRIEERGRRTHVVTLVTTLTDSMRYPKHELANLYGLRWQVETNFKHLKTSMGMAQVKCQTPEGVMKELMIFALVYNLICAAMTMAAQRQGVDRSRISFIDTARWLRSQCTPQKEKNVIDLVVNKLRPGRWNPRVIKGRPKEYDRMNKPRREYTQPVAAQDVAA